MAITPTRPASMGIEPSKPAAKVSWWKKLWNALFGNSKDKDKKYHSHRRGHHHHRRNMNNRNRPPELTAHQRQQLQEIANILNS